MKRKFAYLLLLPIVIFVFGCSESETEIETQKSILEAMPEDVVSFSWNEYLQFASTKNSDLEKLIYLLDPLGIKYENNKITPPASEIAEKDNVGLLISTKVVHYKTKGPNGEDINVSGRITFPFFPTTVRNIILAPMFTITDEKSSPSVCGFSIPLDLFALLGYVIVSPDYIGHGDSKDLQHPFLHNDLTAGACVDMLDVVEKELDWYWQFRKDGMPKDIYIVGLSQAGASALSCARRIEETRPNEYNIIKTMACAGPYSLSATLDYYRKTNNSSTLASVIPYIILGIKYGENLDIDLKNVFKEELYQNYQGWYNKELTTTEINNLLTHNGRYTKVTDFLNDDFIKEDFGGNKDFQAIYEACQKNDNIDWTPQSPIALYHSDSDEVVPYENATLAYDSFLQNGADPSLIKLITYKGKKHVESCIFFLTGLVNKFL